jgi:two-component system, NtrC family, sensor histidine kinase HydH
MKRFLFSVHSVPLVGLGALVAFACLAGSWYISRIQADLTETVRHDAAAMDAADNLQVQLRHLRVHSLVFVADRTDARWEVAKGDLAQVEVALQVVRQTDPSAEDDQLVRKIDQDYAEYKDYLARDRLPPPGGPMDELARWSDAHHMGDILASCRELADRQRERMQGSLQRSEVQAAWAGRVLLVLGFAGVLAGLLSGYVTARTLTRHVAQLLVRVRAVRVHLDENVGAMTVQGPPQFGDLDEQLDRVVERVSAVCQRLQVQERDLLRAEQLAAVGQLATGVAHEIRNPLTGVKLLLQAAVRPQNPTPLTVDRLQLLLQEVARIERTVQGLMDFARPPSLDRRPHDVLEVVGAAISVAESRAEVKSVALRHVSSVEPLRVSVDRDQILSLLTNLLFNAVDASPVGAEVCVSTAVAPSGMIQVSVNDAGPGIDRTAERLFVPFATTKPAGTGLGLTIAQRIAREHGGTLVAANRPGGGACFTLTLPAVEESHVEAPGH